MENIAIVLANNAHPIRCIDLRRTDRVDVKNISSGKYRKLTLKEIAKVYSYKDK